MTTIDDTAIVPDPDTGAELDRDNPDKYEETDDNGGGMVQV